MKKYYLISLVFFLLASCGENKSDRNYDKGWDDGYAVGYNQLCYPNSNTNIHGWFDDRDYSKGYNEGYTYGRRDCQNSRR